MEVVVRILGGLAMAWLWRQGGKTNKNWRRIVAPILAFILTRNIAVALGLAGLGRLPMTLIGDSLHAKGQLFWWVPFICLLHAVLVFLAAGFWPAAVLWLIQYLMILGSNTVDFPKWNWYEKIYGFLFGVVLK